MSYLVASDRTGRRWVLLSVDHRIKCCPWSSIVETDAAQDLAEVIAQAGPLLLGLETEASVGFAALLDTVDLVATDPETASIDQVRLVASFAQSVVLPEDRRRAMATEPTLTAPMRASAIRGAARDEIQGAEVGNKTGGNT